MRDPPSREVLTSCDRQGALLLPELQPPSGGKQCQFVLKLRPLATAPGQVALGEEEKRYLRC